VTTGEKGQEGLTMTPVRKTGRNLWNSFSGLGLGKLNSTCILESPYFGQLRQLDLAQCPFLLDDLSLPANHEAREWQGELHGYRLPHLGTWVVPVLRSVLPGDSPVLAPGEKPVLPTLT
jgi:hypothetical protein